SGAAQAGPLYDQGQLELESVLRDLQAWLPGEWNSFPQIEYERTVRMPAEGEHDHWHRSFALIDAPQVGEVVFYGQINIGSPDGPLISRSQVLYKAWIDAARGAVVINGQTPAEPERFVDLHKRPELWRQVRMRDPDAVRCDFLWRRDGAQIVGVLEGKTAASRKYGPGTCTYTSETTGQEFYADAEWVLTPEELWIYDLNTMGGRRFIGREDRTHIRLYRARPYRCRVRDALGARTLAAFDRGYVADLKARDGSTLQLRLLRAEYPAASRFGLEDRLRLTIRMPDDLNGVPLVTADAAPLAERIAVRLADRGVGARCERLVER
ncbi:MAG: hypothetical protein NZM12_08320, partial [Steroidobacteraceae bacterium]|nr:hypothetical protein [Steroidobacteraceae bacterium]